MIVEYCGKGSLWGALTSGELNKEVQEEQKGAQIWDSSALGGGLVSWDSWAAIELLKEVARAMLYLHDNGIIHGDLKSANVLLSDSTRDRRGYEAKVTDFGECFVTTVPSPPSLSLSLIPSDTTLRIQPCTFEEPHNKNLRHSDSSTTRASLGRPPESNC